MQILFDDIPEFSIPGLNGGAGEVAARMYADPALKIMVSRLPAGAFIGEHPHPASCEVNYVLAGKGRAVCGGAEEELSPGVCHYCPRGSTHSIENTGAEDLVLFTVVPA